MKKLLSLCVLALTCSAVGIYEMKPTLNYTQARLYDECIKEYNSKSCEDYLDTRNHNGDSYLTLKESLEVAFKGCDELKNAYSCHMVANYYDEGYPPNKFIQDNKEKSYEYKLKACEIDKDFCLFVGNHYNIKYIDTKDKKDKKQALKYYKIACDNGYEYSCEKYKRIK